MRISDFRLERREGTARATARVTWEDAARPPFDLFFETDSSAGDDLAAEPEAFVIACFVPAIHHGERRVLVEGTLCPRLAEGIPAAAALLRSWIGPHRRPIEIAASRGLRALVPRQPPRAALFFTGGIDSSNLLSANRRTYPLDHPNAFADALSIHGNIKPESEDSPWNKRALSALAETAEFNGVTLIPVRMNLWDLDPDLAVVTRESLSTALAAAAQCLRRRLTTVSISSGRDIANEVPRGTHPLLDPLYSTSALEIRHDPLRLTRYERLRELAANGAGVLERLIVCMTYPGPPRVNCGECEKCVRTMTQLVALGALERVRTLPGGDVTPEMIRGVRVAPIEAIYWIETLPALARRGRGDLVAAVQAKLAETRRLELWERGAGWKGRLRSLDRRLLGGRLLDLRKRWM